jgi:site-specific recombinase XerD
MLCRINIVFNWLADVIQIGPNWPASTNEPSQPHAAACCGYKLANDGQDTRAIQHFLGHRSIASTVRYTALAPDRFKGFWKD